MIVALVIRDSDRRVLRWSLVKLIESEATPFGNQLLEYFLLKVTHRYGV